MDQSLSCETKLTKNYPLFWNLGVPCHVHNSPSLDRNLIQMNPGCILISFFFSAQCNIILLAMPRSSK
jgi:hypothetical protein